MDQTTQLVGLVAAAAAGLVATLAILRRQRHDRETGVRDSRFAVSTEGMQRCPNCGFGNLVMNRDCSSCGRRLPA